MRVVNCRQSLCTISYLILSSCYLYVAFQLRDVITITLDDFRYNLFNWSLPSCLLTRFLLTITVFIKGWFRHAFQLRSLWRRCQRTVLMRHCSRGDREKVCYMKCAPCKFSSLYMHVWFLVLQWRIRQRRDYKKEIREARAKNLRISTTKTQGCGEQAGSHHCCTTFWPGNTSVLQKSIHQKKILNRGIWNDKNFRRWQGIVRSLGHCCTCG